MTDAIQEERTAGMPSTLQPSILRDSGIQEV